MAAHLSRHETYIGASGAGVAGRLWMAARARTASTSEREKRQAAEREAGAAAGAAERAERDLAAVQQAIVAVNGSHPGAGAGGGGRAVYAPAPLYAILPQLRSFSATDF